MSRVCIFFAPGLEEIEGLTVVDLMRRADIPVRIVSISDTLEVTGAHGIHITADACFADTDFSDTEMLVLPGGAPGTCNLNACEPLKALLKDFYDKGKYIGGAAHVTDDAVVDGHIITSRGLGTAIEFAAALIGLLTDKVTAEDIKKSVMYTKEK